MWLGIETTGKRGGVALVRENGDVLVERLLSVEAFHSEKVLPAVADALEEGRMDGSSLSGIGVSAGPGSYTGLRIGIATASGLSAGWGIPAVGVPTMRALAAPIGSSMPVLVAIRARGGEVFATVYGSSDAGSPELLVPGVYTVGALAAHLPGTGVEVAVGSGRSEMSEVPGLDWVPEDMDLPSPGVVARLAMKTAIGTGTSDPVEPLYLRAFRQPAIGADPEDGS